MNEKAPQLPVILSSQRQDNHLFGQDSEVAEGATEKMISGVRDRGVREGGSSALGSSGLGILIGFSWERRICTDGL